MPVNITVTLRDMLAGTTIKSECGDHWMEARNGSFVMSRSVATELLRKLEAHDNEARQ